MQEMAPVKAFSNARVCVHGQLLQKTIFVDIDSGLIVEEPEGFHSATSTTDLAGCIIAPAFVELQTNGCLGVHFTNYQNDQDYRDSLAMISQHLVRSGVGAFYVTLPTVESRVFRKVIYLAVVESYLLLFM